MYFAAIATRSVSLLILANNRDLGHVTPFKVRQPHLMCAADQEDLRNSQTGWLIW